MASEEHRTPILQERLHHARHRIDALLKDPTVGTVRHLPDDTLELVTCCMNAIADVIERRRALDNEQPNQHAE